MRLSSSILLCILTGLSLTGQGQSWQSTLLTMDGSGRLEYHRDADGFILPDFSHAGYMGGGVDLPEVPVVHEISPIEGDNTKHIQDAINYLGTLPLDSDGIRGALLLKAGTYDVYGTLYVRKDGIVLRGEGEGKDSTSTLIYARGNSPYQRDVILLGSTTRITGTELPGTRSYILSDTVRAGSRSFRVEDASQYQVGERIIIYHPASQAWVEAVDFGGVPDADEKWTEGQLPIPYNRFIEGIEGNRIRIDAPVFYSLNRSLSDSYIYKPNMNGLVSKVGLEHLRVDIETAGGSDEAHAWQAVRFKSVENAWARNCTFVHFGQSGIITEACYRSTFKECSAIDPVAKVDGERMYNFNTYHYSQLNLFTDCYAKNGRHHYVSNGTSSTSGNVFLRCISDSAKSVNEGHRQWTQGMLYDNHRDIHLIRDFVLGLYNRVDKGTGHGWSAVQSVLWNCDIDESYGEIGLQKPPTSQNYAIGCMAKSITGNPISETNFTRGYVEGHNQDGLEPASLYEAQLSFRLQTVGLNREASPGTIRVYPTLVNEALHLDFGPGTGSKIIRIRSLSGALVSETHSRDAQLVLQSELPMEAGMYLLDCIVGGERHCSKFIKN